jgi:hypothetical protein
MYPVTAFVERERSLLRPRGIPLFQPREDRPRSSRWLRQTKRMTAANVERWLGPSVIPGCYLSDLLLWRKGLAIFINPGARDRAHAH